MSTIVEKKFKLSALAVAMVLSLTACDGDDGAQGPAGIQGEQEIGRAHV